MKKNLMKNNLFTYATSELSQDAFICWLMSFAHEEYLSVDPHLTDCARELLAIMIGSEEEFVITKISRQYKNIDVLLDVSHKYRIIVEDKTFTSQHGGQIKKYKEELEAESDNYKIICVYYKIMEQAFPEKDVVNITRQDLLELFGKYKEKTKNHIFQDYYEYLRAIDCQVKRYATDPIEKWTDGNDHAYKGFFSHLIQDGVIDIRRTYDWSYVANPSGGFRALWWYFLSNDELNGCNLLKEYVEDLYLQIEDQVIAVKLSGKRERSTQVRWSLFDYIKGKVPGFQKKTFRPGNSMTVGYVEYNETDYREKIAMMQGMMESIVRREYWFNPE